MLAAPAEHLWPGGFLSEVGPQCWMGSCKLPLEILLTQELWKHKPGSHAVLLPAAGVQGCPCPLWARELRNCG